MLGALHVDLDKRRFLTGVVAADLLDVPAVTGAPTVHNNDSIGGLLLFAHPRQADPHRH